MWMQKTEHLFPATEQKKKLRILFIYLFSNFNCSAHSIPIPFFHFFFFLFATLYASLFFFYIDAYNRKNKFRNEKKKIIHEWNISYIIFSVVIVVATSRTRKIFISIRCENRLETAFLFLFVFSFFELFIQISVLVFCIRFNFDSSCRNNLICWLFGLPF